MPSSRWISADFAWESSERLATYVILTLLIVAELLASFVESIDKVLTGGGEIALLAAALLLTFRMIDRHLQEVQPAFDPEDFGNSVASIAKGSPIANEVRLMANDASKYYYFIGESKLKISGLQIIVSDDSQAEKWRRLVKQGAVKSLEIRRTENEPVMHLFLVDERFGMFGMFMRRSGMVSPGQVFNINGRSPSGRELLHALIGYFDSEWERAVNEVVVSGGAEG